MTNDGSRNGERQFLVVAHTGREVVTATLDAIACRCAASDIGIRVVEYDMRTFPGHAEVEGGRPVDPDHLRDIGVDVEVTAGDVGSAQGCEVVIVLGGDGTFLRAAELAYPCDVPVLGINLGHIGFLAEAEANRVDEVVEALIVDSYRVEPRMTLDVRVSVGDEVIGRSWAMNEVSVQNASQRGVLSLVTEIDSRPVSAFGADGILVSTPTGSTAYAFSAGGPIMWPDLEAILVVPSNAHALFARPLVTSPRSTIAIETESGHQDAVALCDGRRTIAVPPGARVEVNRGAAPINWVRIDSEPFTDRLVSKFDLPVTGWRGRQG